MALFPLGSIVATPDAIRALEAAGTSAAELLRRHATGDWGELDAEDVQSNNDAVRHGNRILSSYPLDAHTKVWIITEWDRSATTLLLPENY